MRIEKLKPEHNVDDFNCGDNPIYAPLNEYVRRYAGQNDRRYNTATYVLLNDDDNRVIGYYTTTVKQLDAAVVPASEKLGRYPMPVALLGRLAVDKNYQGNKYGELLLVDALRRITRVATELGIRAIEVTAKDEKAQSFYKRYGFQPLLDDSLHLYLAVKVIVNTPLITGSQ